jgi:dTDP-4-dehydrorhamnose reductase
VRRLLVLGGTGMLGHAMWEAARERVDTYATVRAAGGAPGDVALDPERTVAGVRAEDPAGVAAALDAVAPDAVVNCIGIVKQADAAADAVGTVRVNALFPHELAAACRARDIRLVHVSTDCVFSGRRGAYSEEDLPDPADLYGRSKLLGEPAGPGVLTLRTSMIGWEPSGRRQGLLEWFAAQAGGRVSGFTRAVFSGPTAPVLARAILDLLDGHPALEGTWHVGAAPIDKHALLLGLRDALALDVEIVADATVVIDRSLDATRLRAATGWSAPDWPEMMEELARGAVAGSEEATTARR